MDNIKIIGHRGNQGFATENSLEAIMSCSDSKDIDGTEFDIRPTADNKIVIMHNATINGTTNSKGRIQDLTLEELKQYRFKTQLADQVVQRTLNIFNKDRYFFNQYCSLGKQSSNIALFEQIMHDYSKDKHMLIELKGKLGEYSDLKQQIFEDNIVNILKEADYQNRDLTLEGYNFDALFRIKNKLPDLRIIALINSRGSLKPLDMDFDGVSLEYPLINKKVVEKIMEKKMILYSWDDKIPMKHYAKVSNIISTFEKEIENGELPLYIINDFPEKARQYIKK